MGILLNSLVAVCTANYSNPKDQYACLQTSQAGLQQSGVQQQVDSAEDHTVQYVNRKAEKHMGKTGLFIVGGTYFVVRTAQTKSLSIGLPTLGLCESTKVEVSQSQSVLRLEWTF